MTDRDTASTERTRTEPAGAERATLRDVNHTHPYTGESFGRTQTYSRGRIIAADGGKASGARRPSSDASAPDGGDENGDRTAADDQTMADVDHEPPKDADQANRAYQRGNEDAV